VSLPISMNAALVNSAFALGVGSYLDVSTGQIYIHTAIAHSDRDEDPVSQWRSQWLTLTFAAPATWAMSDEIGFGLTYETAQRQSRRYRFTIGPYSCGMSRMTSTEKPARRHSAIRQLRVSQKLREDKPLSGSSHPPSVNQRPDRPLN
jgi:hypothetical protein